MNSFNNNSLHGPGGSVGSVGFEESLRTIARLPAPEGLEERVIAAVRTDSGQRGAHHRAPLGSRPLQFPAALRQGSGWMRGAAAAAIVSVVAGGGWGIYSRVQTPQAARVIAMPARMTAPGGFSNAGAMRTPTTLSGPSVPVQVTPAQAQKTQSQPGAKTQTAKKANRRAAPTSSNKAAVQPVAAAK